MDVTSKSSQLFQLTTQIICFGEDNYQQKILEEVSAIFDFNACAILNVIDYETCPYPMRSCSHRITDVELFKFLEMNCMLGQFSDPYIGSFDCTR